jgi:hypothetical protein
VKKTGAFVRFTGARVETNGVVRRPYVRAREEDGRIRPLRGRARKEESRTDPGTSA